MRHQGARQSGRRTHHGKHSEHHMHMQPPQPPPPPPLPERRLRARAAAAPAPPAPPRDPAARGAAAGMGPAADGLQQPEGAWASAGGWQLHSLKRWDDARLPSMHACTPGPGHCIPATSTHTSSQHSAAAAPRPSPDGRPSSAKTVSATLSPSACWLYLRMPREAGWPVGNSSGLDGRQPAGQARQGCAAKARHRTLHPSRPRHAAATVVAPLPLQLGLPMRTRPPAAAAGGRRRAPQPGAARRKPASGSCRPAAAAFRAGLGNGRRSLHVAEGGHSGCKALRPEGWGARGQHRLPGCAGRRRIMHSAGAFHVRSASHAPCRCAAAKAGTAGTEPALTMMKSGPKRRVAGATTRSNTRWKAACPLYQGSGTLRVAPAPAPARQVGRLNLMQAGAAPGGCTAGAQPDAVAPRPLASTAPPAPVSSSAPLPGHTFSWCRSISMTEGSSKNKSCSNGSSTKVGGVGAARLGLTTAARAKTGNDQRCAAPARKQVAQEVQPHLRAVAVVNVPIEYQDLQAA